MTADEAHDELAAYTLSLGDPAFVHQHVVDAWAAQHATSSSKPIGVAFALIGLCLHVEHGMTGREIQRRHMELARIRRDWPHFEPPPMTDTITVLDVLAAPDRIAMIDRWCESVWSAWSTAHAAVRALVTAP